MSSKNQTDKISKNDLLACKYIKNKEQVDGKIEFSMHLMSWKERDGSASPEILQVTCPDINMISYKSFSPSHYKDIPIGFWIQSLITREGREDKETPKDFLYESLMDQSLEEFRKEMGDAAGVGLAFIELAIKALRK